jgi:hypothetical protein
MAGHGRARGPGWCRHPTGQSETDHAPGRRGRERPSPRRAPLRRASLRRASLRRASLRPTRRARPPCRRPDASAWGCLWARRPARPRRQLAVRPHGTAGPRRPARRRRLTGILSSPVRPRRPGQVGGRPARPPRGQDGSRQHSRARRRRVRPSCRRAVPRHRLPLTGPPAAPISGPGRATGRLPGRPGTPAARREPVRLRQRRPDRHRAGHRTERLRHHRQL